MKDPEHLQILAAIKRLEAMVVLAMSKKKG
jgi:hypothetical protein